MDNTGIRQFTRDEFLHGIEPFEFIYRFENDTFQRDRMIEIICDNARDVGIRNFKKMYGEYVKSLKKQSGVVYADSVTQFQGQELELNCGQWKADDMGIYIYANGKEVYACCHPIMPIERLVNVDTGIEKLRLAYKKGGLRGTWRTIIADKRTLASAQSIVSLADYGIAVNSETAKPLVRYLHDIENLNYDLIPEKNSVSRLGWIDEDNFSPYVGNLVFDGDLSFKSFFEAVSERGNYEDWLNIARQVRKDSVYARILLAASFSSVLVEPLGCLPFFCHIWGGTESGKTVGLMLAASVWANPEKGKYWRTFNSTAVGQEKAAGFVNSMPLIFDELQIESDKKSFDKIIYSLSEGVGRSRGARSGGLQRLETWACAILTSGEMPLTTLSSGGGAVNRIIEIECLSKIFENPHQTANIIRKNHGFAGKVFVEKLQKTGLEKAKKIFQDYYALLLDSEATDKQAMSAALVLTADVLAEQWIFQDHISLQLDDVSEFLQTKDEVSVNQRAYAYISEYAAQNANHFSGKSDQFEIWGKFEGDAIYIVNREFNRICIDAGFNAGALKSWLKQHNLLIHSTGRLTKKARINERAVECVVFHASAEDINETLNLDDFEEI